ncbi:MAG: hypothetical protein BWY57_02652 [Betaproteobacteria bacterium ADurb.Bin341]|nr:MAG: hypothetical protein BWY57_02652 [Betaproteobacteria bacterium ADurb.Bin341]
MEIIDLLLALLAQDEVIDHARTERAGAIKGEHGDDVFKPVGRQFLQQLFHAFRFHLENGRRIGLFQDLVGRRVVEAQTHQIELFAGQAFDVFQRQLDDGEVAQAQEVEFDQAGLFDIVLVELRHR